MSDEPDDSERRWQFEQERWRYEQDQRIAEKHHDRAHETALRLMEATVSNATVALRATLLINGGAAVAMLAFLGALGSIETLEVGANLSILAAPLEWFAWGVALSTLGMVFAYVTNYCFSQELGSRKENYKHPYIEETGSTKYWRRAARAFHIVAFGVTVVSIVFFIIGMIDVRKAIIDL